MGCWQRAERASLTGFPERAGQPVRTSERSKSLCHVLRVCVSFAFSFSPSPSAVICTLSALVARTLCARTQSDLSLFRWHPALCERAHLWGKSLRSVPNAWLFSPCHLPQLFPFRLSSRSPLVLVTAERKQARRREMGCGYHGTPDMRRKHNDSLCVDTRSAAAPFYNLQKHRGKEGRLSCET